MEQVSQPPIDTHPDGVPYVVMHTRGGNFSTFNVVPVNVLTQSLRLLLLGSVPFHFNLIPAAVSPLIRMPYWHFHIDGEPFGPRQPIRFRSLIVWSSYGNALELVDEILAYTPLLLLLVTDGPAAAADFNSKYADRPNVATINVTNPDTGAYLWDTPQRIWKRYVELVHSVFPQLFPSAWQVEPALQYSFEEVIRCIDEGTFVPPYAGLDRVPVSDDLIARPNQIQLNFRLGKIPNWDFEVKPDDPPAYAVEVSRRLLAVRTLQTLYEQARMLHAQTTPESETAINDLMEFLPESLRSELLTVVKLPPDAPNKTELLRELLKMMPVSDMTRFFIPQVILICPSASWVPRAAIKFRESHKGGYMLNEAEELKTEYGRNLLELVAQGGRYLVTPQPQTEQDAKILRSMYSTLQKEAQFLSAVSLHCATRFTCPILKAERIGNELFARFKAINEIFEHIDEGNAESQISQHKKAGHELTGLARHLSQLIHEPYKKFLLELERPIVHTFADFPPELMELGGDFLGYRSELSRTPITPGEISLSNIEETSVVSNLPESEQDILFVTPFNQTDPEFQSLWTYLSKDYMQMSKHFVTNPTDLMERLSHRSARCLIYFGHGYHDPVGDESGLVLQNHLLTSADLDEIDRVPPIVILVGCNTAAAASILGGLHISFLAKGVRLLVATSFPVEKQVGALFLYYILNALVSGPRFPDLRDLSQVVFQARRSIRAASDLLSFVRQGKLPESAYMDTLAEFSAESQSLAMQGTGGDYLLEAERNVLHRRGLIPSLDTEPVEWNIIPYPLFFTLLGFPWTTWNPSFTRRLVDGSTG
jgi:hypothetical protein